MPVTLLHGFEVTVRGPPYLLQFLDFSFLDRPYLASLRWQQPSCAQQEGLLGSQSLSGFDGGEGHSIGKTFEGLCVFGIAQGSHHASEKHLACPLSNG